MGMAIAVDSSGNAYVTGYTASTNFPTANPFQASYGGGYYDAFVTKLNASGNALIYSTYLGGSDGDYGLWDRRGLFRQRLCDGLYVFHQLPHGKPIPGDITAEAYDAFVTKLNASGNALVYSTYLGGSDR